FCRWLSDKLGYLVRLPTEQEWEKAARGPHNLIYPYGNEYDAAKANTGRTGIGQTTAVGIFPDETSPYGVQDMSGNVLEWCLTKYGYSQAMMVDDSGDGWVVRGGSWGDNQIHSVAIFRFGVNPGFRNYLYGFR